ncbi:MAG: RHS repeat protein, partial [Deltaproteobacteria bacterium]
MNGWTPPRASGRRTAVWLPGLLIVGIALLSAGPANARLTTFFQNQFSPSFPTSDDATQFATVAVRGAMGSPGLVLYNENREPVPPGTNGATPRWVEYWTEEDPDQPETIESGARALSSDVEFCTECVAVARAAWDAENTRLTLELDRLEALENEEGASVVRKRLDRRLAAQLSPEITSLLVDPDEFVVATAEGTIAYQVAYFVPTDSDGSFCAADLYGLQPSASTAWTGTQFRSCDTRTMEALLAPMRGQVTATSHSNVATTVNQHGFYSLQIHSIIGSHYGVDAVVRWSTINPRAGAGTLHLSGFTGTVASGAMINVNFPVDIRVMSASYAFENVLRLENGFGDVCTVAMVDTSADAPDGLRPGGIQTVTTDPALAEAWPAAHTAYSTNFEGICTSGPGCDNARLSPACSGDHKGLVSRIEANDILNTTVYVFRESDGRLLGKRWGVPQHGINCDPAAAFGDQSHLCRPVTGRTLGAEGQLRFTVRGPSLQPRFEVDNRLQDEVLEQELTDFHSNPIRPGDSLRIVAINHATGYIGTARTTVSGEVLGEPVPQITLRPPNLRIWAERTWTVSDGATAGEDRRNTIGGEGSGLISDQTLTVYTEWLDEDGSPLPDGLPGYTGRVARVIAEPGEDVEHLGRLLPVGDGEEDDGAEHVGQFSIVPGRSTQVLRLPAAEGADRAHYYVHVSGTSLEHGARESTGPEEGPSYSVLEVCFRRQGGGDAPIRCVTREINVDPDAPADIMRERPMRLVPVLTPRYNQAATLAARQAALALGRQDPGPVNDWVYMPEYHFSLLELEEIQVGRRNRDGADVPMLGEDAQDDDATFRSDDQWLWSDAIVGEPDEEDLGRFSGGREFGMFIGDAEGAREEDGRWVFLPEQLGSLDADDYTTIRLAQGGDEGNTLWEFAFEVERLELARRYHRPVFDGGHPQPHLEVPVDDYRIIEIALGDDATVRAEVVGLQRDYQTMTESEVRVSLLRSTSGADGEPGEELDDVHLEAGEWRLPVTFEDILDAGFDPVQNPEFEVEVHRVGSEGTVDVALMRMEGILVDRRTGLTRGQGMFGHVRLHDGSLSLHRVDAQLPGRGVPFELSRRYETVEREEGILGRGWTHGSEQFATPLVWVSDDWSPPEPGSEAHYTSTPPWVDSSRNRFATALELAPFRQRLLSIEVLGITFIDHENEWRPARGENATLVRASGQEAQAAGEFGVECGIQGCLRLQTVHGDEYWFRYPGQPIPEGVSEPSGRVPLRYLQPQRERLLLVTDRHRNATRYRYFTPPDEAAMDQECVSNRMAGRLCRIELDLRPETASSPVRTCSFRYKHMGELASSQRSRLTAVICAPQPGWSGHSAPALEVHYHYDETTGYLTAVHREGGLRAETYEYEIQPNGNPELGARNLVSFTDPVGSRTGVTYATELPGLSSEHVDEGLVPGNVVIGVVVSRSGQVAESPCPSEVTGDLTWAYEYNELNRQVLDPANLGNEIELNRFGNLVALASPRGLLNYDWTLNNDDEIDSTEDNVLTSARLSHTSFAGDGRSESFSYGAAFRGVVDRIEDGEGGVQEFEWHDSLALVTRATNKRTGAEVSIERLPDGRPTAMTDAQGEEWSFELTDTGEPGAVTAPGDEGPLNGYVVPERNAIGLVTSISRPGMAAEAFEYDWRGNLRQMTRDGMTTRWTYDNLGNPESRVLPDISPRLPSAFEGEGFDLHHENQESWRYDALGRLVEHRDLLGTTWHYEYDAFGNLVSMGRDADGAALQFGYDALGNVVRETDWNGTRTCHEFVWDNSGTTVTTTNSREDTMTQVFNAAGELVRVRDYLDRQIERSLDGLGRVTAETLLVNGATEYRRTLSYRDALAGFGGGALEITATTLRGAGHAESSVVTVLDVNGRPTSRTVGGVLTEHWEYDPRGNLVRQLVIEDQNRDCTIFGYDGADRPVFEEHLGRACGEDEVETEGEAIRTEFAYLEGTRLVKHITIGGAVAGSALSSRQTMFSYDAWNRLVSETTRGPHESFSTDFTLDGFGNVIAMVDPQGHAFGTLRDQLGRIVLTTDQSLLGSHFSPAPVNRGVTRSYFPDGQLRQEIDPYGATTTVQRDEHHDRVLAIEEAGPGVGTRSTNFLQHDAMGNPTQAQDVMGVVWTYEYSPRLELAAACVDLDDGVSACRRWEYLADGSLVHEMDMDGNSTTYAYDPQGRMESVTDSVGLTSHYRYALGGHVATTVDHRGWVSELEYDDFWRISALREGPQSVEDESGEEGNGEERPVVVRYVTNALGEVVSVSDAYDNAVTYEYDVRGLPIRITLPPNGSSQSAHETRTYNAAGFLTSVTDPDGVVVAYEVDAMGRVLAEVLAPETPDEARTSYAYDAVGRVTEVVRPRHQGTEVARRMEWDGLGRLARVVDEAGNETNYGWNAR